MGFSLVVKEMISAKKPIIGHNCMYDLLYLYNQFIDELPSTFNEFVLKWNTLFPETFDSKVLATNSRVFFKSTLSDIHSKIRNDEKLKNLLTFNFDVKNSCTKYQNGGA